jgi:hypothetical protein
MKTIFAFIVAAAVLGTCFDASAQDDGWNFTITPYAWLAGLEGETGVGLAQAEIDKSFSDIVEDLDMAAMLALDANNGSFGFVGDMFFVDLEAGSQTALGEFKGEMDQWILTAVPYFRVEADKDVTFDLGIGVRYMDTDLEVTTPARSSSRSKAWASPLLFGRMNVPLGEKAFVNCSLDVGGFGVETDFMWQFVGAAGYAVSESVDLVLAYRHLDVDFEDGLFVYDVKTKGFALGARIEL